MDALNNEAVKRHEEVISKLRLFQNNIKHTIKEGQINLMTMDDELKRKAKQVQDLQTQAAAVAQQIETTQQDMAKLKEYSEKITDFSTQCESKLEELEAAKAEMLASTASCKGRLKEKDAAYAELWSAYTKLKNMYEEDD